MFLGAQNLLEHGFEAENQFLDLIVALNQLLDLLLVSDVLFVLQNASHLRSQLQKSDQRLRNHDGDVGAANEDDGDVDAAKVEALEDDHLKDLVEIVLDIGFVNGDCSLREDDQVVIVLSE